MGSSATASLCIRDQAGTPIPAPLEWSPALIEVCRPLDRWNQYRLWRNGLELPITLRHLGNRVAIIAEWTLAGAGHYHLRLETPDEVEDVRVTVQPRKLSPAAFRQLLDDLERRLPATIALGLQRTGALAGIQIVPPDETTLAAEVEHVRRAIAGGTGQVGLATILPAIARDPHHVLGSMEKWAERTRARRPPVARLPAAIARRANIDAQGRVLRVIDERVEPSVDVYENRLLRAYVEEVAARLRRLQRITARRSDESLSQSVKRLARELAHARRGAAFLDEVQRPQQLPIRVTMVLLRRPLYRAALEGYLALHRRLVVHLDDPALEAPLENLPHLYQAWGTLMVMAALLEVGAEFGYRVAAQRLVRRDGFGLGGRALPGGKAALVLAGPRHATRVTLRVQPTYGPGPGLRSISFAQRPDVAVEVDQPGERSHVLLFDPKYKLHSDPVEVSDAGRPAKADIDAMHAYRDAIRDATGDRVVDSALILYPGPTVYFGDGIGALQADPSRPESLHEDLMEVLRPLLRHAAFSTTTKGAAIGQTESRGGRPFQI